MRIKYCLIVLLLLPFYTLFAQEDPKFSLLPWLQPYFNPGAMGEKDNHVNLTGILGQFAAGMHGDPNQTNSDNSDSSDPDKGSEKGAPQNGEQILLQIDSYIKQIRGAVGVSFLSDKNGGQFENVDRKSVV